MKLKGGVLLIGSLFWQDDRKDKDGIRKNWRNQRLIMSEARNVEVPIRYGRLSTGGSYTMVYDQKLKIKNYGNGKFVPFSKNTFSKPSDIIKEAKSLSRAEGPGDALFKGIKRGNEAWCICSFLINPKRIDHREAESIIAEWKKEVLSTPDPNGAMKSISSELGEDGVKPNYELDLAWPEEVADFDFLLATATKSVPEIETKEIAKRAFHRPYFFPNLAHGITTYQDSSITDEIEGRRDTDLVPNKNRLFSYCLPVDDGAAPNPYFGICSLAICKPVIRRVAKVGDWVAGVGSKDVNGKDLSGKLVYAMKVTQIETMEAYDELCKAEIGGKIPDFQSKDPKRWVGDCIYDFSRNIPKPKLRESVHNEVNAPTDLNGKKVLLSNEFYYFGDDPIDIPEHLHGIIKQGQAHKSNANNPLKNAFVEFIENSGFDKNILHGKPQLPFRIGQSYGCNGAEERSRCAKEDLKQEGTDV